MDSIEFRNLSTGTCLCILLIVSLARTWRMYQLFHDHDVHENGKAYCAVFFSSMSILIRCQNGARVSIAGAGIYLIPCKHWYMVLSGPTIPSKCSKCNAMQCSGQMPPFHTSPLTRRHEALGKLFQRPSIRSQYRVTFHLKIDLPEIIES